MRRAAVASVYVLAIVALVLLSPMILIVLLVSEVFETAADSYKTPF